MNVIVVVAIDDTVVVIVTIENMVAISYVC